MTVTYLCVISSTDNPTVEYFRSLIAPYILILFSGYNTSNNMISAILHKDRLILNNERVIYLPPNGYVQIQIVGSPLKLFGLDCTVYTYGIK